MKNQKLPKNIPHITAVFVLAVIWFVPTGFAEAEKFSSGLLRSYSVMSDQEHSPENAAFEKFLKANFLEGKNGITWRQIQEVRDATHVHRLYELTFQGRRVLQQFVKLHYSHKGFIQFATSTWSTQFLGEGYFGNSQLALTIFQGDIQRRFGRPVETQVDYGFIQDGKDQRLLPVLLIEGRGRHPAALNRWIVDERTGKTISERSMVRFGDEHRGDRSVLDYGGTSNVYALNPPLTGGTGTLDNGILHDITAPIVATSTLVGPYLEVRRGRNNGDPVDIQFQTSYSTDPTNWDGNDPAKYPNPASGLNTCNSTLTNDCPNQSFDGVNVYHHLSSFRNKMITYLNTDLGVTTCGSSTTPCFPADPLKVIVNAQPITSGGRTISSNNAAYIPNCAIFGYTRCLVFFKPAPIDGTDCGGTAVTKVFNVAREANVVVHEFQHYITDSITNIAFASSSSLNVGDALHEGYSDYFAASHVVDTTGKIIGAKILGYSFQNCPAIIRDVAVPRIYKVDSSRTAHYDVGLTWASGLYQLRTELGSARSGDLLALKSQFFLTPNPGYIEAVEALVKADQALNQGTHVTRIRQLFYTDLKFINGGPSPFRSADSLIAEVGFKSCTSIGMAQSATSSWSSLAAFFAWLSGLLFAGRHFSQRRRS